MSKKKYVKVKFSKFLLDLFFWCILSIPQKNPIKKQFLRKITFFGSKDEFISDLQFDWGIPVRPSETSILTDPRGWGGLGEG